MISETRVRKGEKFEALCFQSDKHPHIEIAAQNCCVFYISSRRVCTINSFLTQELAENFAKEISYILEYENPYSLLFNSDFIKCYYDKCNI